jgi:hypothetical protein
VSKKMIMITISAALEMAACTTSSPKPPDRGPQVVIAPSGDLSTGVSLTDSGAVVPEGLVLSLSLIPYEDGGTVALQPQDPSQVLVAPTGGPGGFVIGGLRPGKTSLHVLLDGRETTSLAIEGDAVGTFEVQVTPQSPPN